jgi:hypothetical protein
VTAFLFAGAVHMCVPRPPSATSWVFHLLQMCTAPAESSAVPFGTGRPESGVRVLGWFGGPPPPSAGRLAFSQRQCEGVWGWGAQGFRSQRAVSKVHVGCIRDASDMQVPQVHLAHLRHLDHLAGDRRPPAR